MSLYVRVGVIPIHLSGSWQNKGDRHSLVLLTINIVQGQLKLYSRRLASGTLQPSDEKVDVHVDLARGCRARGDANTIARYWIFTDFS